MFLYIISETHFIFLYVKKNDVIINICRDMILGTVSDYVIHVIRDTIDRMIIHKVSVTQFDHTVAAEQKTCE